MTTDNIITPGTNGNGTIKVRGRIKSLKRNYGFIGAADGQDYFFYWTYLHEKSKTFKSLSVGDTVSFEPEKAEDKLRARNIITLD